MRIKENTRFLIVGLGLIGGSYADVLIKKDFHVSAFARRKETIDIALSKGLISEGYDYVNEDVIKKSDFIIFALYPHIFIEWIEKYAHLISPGTLITDVTGVKSSVVYRVQSMLPQGVEFVASHPMAGREVSGVENASGDIFKGANFVVTPTPDNTEESVETVKMLGWMLGFARVSVLTPEEHDDMIGFLSQLTHCIAVCLMTGNEKPNLERYTGDSFRDLTRIARINDVMWSELFLLNKEKLLSNIDVFMAELQKLRTAVKDDDVDTMRKMMRMSSDRRILFDKKK
ncbi:MAG: prephenate dehydrogenase [Clostridiales bacterium]|nr:prephenate dehydrogenase [Clostridiales bacterium]